MSRALAVTCAWCALALLGCERQVFVRSDESAMTSSIMPGSGGASGFGAAGFGPAGFGAPPIAGAAGGTPTAGQGGALAGSGGLAGDQASSGAGGSDQPPAGILAGIEQAWPSASSALDRFEVLTQELSTIERPAAGTNGASLTQFQGATRALTLHVGWDGSVERWYKSSGAYRAYNAAHLDRHFSLLHAESYGIYADGGEVELSGTPQTYKEALAAGGLGLAWIDYPAPADSMFGEIVLQRSDGTRAVLSDRARYRSSLVLSESHVAYVEYASAEPGSAGQVWLQAVASGVAFAVAPGGNHQDRPALAGEWLVFEEYVSSADAVIRAFNVTTGELRDASASGGFRTNADVRNARVVWEDYRDGDADIFGIMLGAGDEQAMVSGAGHSAVARLTDDGVIWIEAAGSTTALVRARWRAEP